MGDGGFGEGNLRLSILACANILPYLVLLACRHAYHDCEEVLEF